MENTPSNQIPTEEEETLATPRFSAQPAAPQRVVPLERIRARTASAVRRVRYRVTPAGQSPRLKWLPAVVVMLLAGVAGGFFLTRNNGSESIEDAPVVRSELEAAPRNSGAETKKSAFVERENSSGDSQAGAENFRPGPSSSGNESPAPEEKPEISDEGVLKVEEKPRISTEVEVRSGEKPSAKQGDSSSEDERLDLIRKDAERQAAREREERDRQKRNQKNEDKQEEKPKGERQNKNEEKPNNDNSEESANTDISNGTA